MLRPSRPMMRPFMSSAGSWTTRHRRLGRVAGGEALHDDGEDVAHAPVGVALGLLLDLADEPRRVVADLVLELLEQQLLGLRGGQAGHALERADVALVRARRPPAARSRERALARVELGGARVERLLARRQALLEAPDLLPARRARRRSRPAAAGLGGGAPRPGARRGAAPAAASPGARSPAAAPRPPGRPRARPPRSRFPLSVSSPRTPPCRARRDPMLRCLWRRQTEPCPGHGARRSAWKAACGRRVRWRLGALFEVGVAGRARRWACRRPGMCRGGRHR